MISEMGPCIDISMKAGEDFVDSDGDDTSYIYKVVTLNSDEEVIKPTAITDKPFGILLEGAEENDYVTVRIFGICPVKVIAGIATPNFIGIGIDVAAVDGRVNTAVATNYVIGQLIDTATAEDDIVNAFINCSNCPLKA